jgi:hypothetical protein
LLAAAFYRAARCWIHYISIRQPGSAGADYITAHDDSVIWVLAILLLGFHALSTRRRSTVTRALLGIVFLCVAIEWNRRRLAWVSLVMGLLVGYFLTPYGAVRQRVARIARVAVPVLLLYATVGWGRPERVFTPLRSLSSVSTQEDQSTRARNVENLGLIATVRESNLFTGTGWGHPYKEVSSKYSIALYMDYLWRFIPHNSILGLLAFSGAFGFAGYWLPFPTAIFLNSRLARLGNVPAARSAGFVAAVGMVVCANQLFGDMGLHSLRTMYTLACCYAVALRLPPVAGAW